MDKSEYIEYRIVSRRPRDIQGWAYRRFTGSESQDPEHIHRVLAHARENRDGWLFRVEARRIMKTTSAWRPVGRLEHRSKKGLEAKRGERQRAG